MLSSSLLRSFRRFCGQNSTFSIVFIILDNLKWYFQYFYEEKHFKKQKNSSKMTFLPGTSWMSEHPGLEFAPQKPRSQILPSMSSLVLFIISMVKVVCPHWSQQYGGLSWMANTDWPDLKFIVDWLITNSTDSKYLNLLFALQYFVFLQKDLATFEPTRGGHLWCQEYGGISGVANT